MPLSNLRMTMKTILCLLAAVALTTLATAENNPFHLKDGDRVVFYGDSITDQRLYTTFAETFVVTRFPGMNVSFVHSGWGGDRVTGGGGGAIDLRLTRDVFAHKPTVMTVMLGMNDASYKAFDAGVYSTYTNGYQHIVDSMKKNSPSTRMTLIQPSPFDDVTQPPKFEGGYNNVLVQYGAYVKDLAKREHLGVADLNTAVVAALEKAKAKDAEKAKKIIPDRVHPGASGHLLMAAELLKAWNAPKFVSCVEIDAANKLVAKQCCTTISGLSTKGTVSWSQLDQALPMPVDMGDETMKLAVNSSDFIEALNQQTLKVTGLTGAKYVLKIDGNRTGEFTREQLEAGINLAMMDTPMAKQASEVHKLTIQHNQIHFERWREVQVRLAKHASAKISKATKALLAAFDSEEAAVITKQRSAAKPVKHQFELAGTN